MSGKECGMSVKLWHRGKENFISLCLLERNAHMISVHLSVSVGSGLPNMWDAEDQSVGILADLALSDQTIHFHKRIERFRQRISISLTLPRADKAEEAWFAERLSMYRLHTRIFSDLEQEIRSTSRKCKFHHPFPVLRLTYDRHYTLVPCGSSLALSRVLSLGRSQDKRI
jgi:hypothetical protein